MLEVRVVPNSPWTGFTGTRAGAYVLRVNAPPRDGRANRAAIRYLAEFFGVGRSSVRVVAGEKSRHKKVEILGLEPARGIARLRNFIENSEESHDPNGQEKEGAEGS